MTLRRVAGKIIVDDSAGRPEFTPLITQAVVFDPAHAGVVPKPFGRESPIGIPVNRKFDSRNWVTPEHGATEYKRANLLAG